MKEEQYKNWLNAQIHEKEHHRYEFNDKFDDYHSKNYYSLYYNYFKLLNINFNDLKGESILEIGAGKIAGLFFSKNYGKSYIIEPQIFDDAKKYSEELGITVINKPAELIELPEVDSVWMFNLLQHVIDPEEIIDKTKKCAKTVYFFEPINVEFSSTHIHKFSLQFFADNFGDSTKLYRGGSIGNFHLASCAYGKYNCIK